MTTLSTAKDLTAEAPASPRTRVGGYAILARMTDKGRAAIAGNVGDYHFDCPLDNMLLGWKGVKGTEIKAELEQGASDEEIAAYLDAHGTPKTAEEIKEWSDGMEAVNPYYNEEKKEWYVGEVTKLGLDPAATTLFDWLEADDKASFQK